MKKSLFSMIILCIIGLQSVLAQGREISGIVTSADDGVPIPGVSVSIKGTTIGTVTNIDGAYQIKVPNDATILVFSFVGMKKMEIPIQGSVVNIVMEADVLGVDEVMVVAYGTTTKGSYTGSAAVVDSEQIELRPITNVTSALEGTSAGVQVTAGSGQPGSGQSIRIRGFGSVDASSSPLYVVDGVPYNNSISAINTNDIESLTVLKDAASTALYGNKAANGVVMITTKKGKKGRGGLSINTSMGIVTRAQPEYDLIGDKDYYPRLCYKELLINLDYCLIFLNLGL